MEYISLIIYVIFSYISIGALAAIEVNNNTASVSHGVIFGLLAPITLPLALGRVMYNTSA